jgi:ferredoxin-type protein NapH
LCPYRPLHALSEAARTGLARLGFRPPDLRMDRATPFAILAGVLGLTAVSGAVVAPLVYPPAILGREIFRWVFFGSVGFGAVAIGLIFLFETLVSRGGFCNYVCPGGALFRLVGLASPVAVRRDPELCTDCGTCDEVCSLRQSPMTDGLDSGCERCGSCVAACPTAALKLRPSRPLLTLIGAGRKAR